MESGLEGSLSKVGDRGRMHHSRGVQVAHGHTDATRATWGVGIVPSAVLLPGSLRSALWRSLCAPLTWWHKN